MKRIVLITLCVMLFVPVCANAVTLEFTIGSNVMYESNGGIQKTELENAPYTQNNRTMVPVRIISEKFGAEVGWDEEKAEVTIKKDDKTILLTLGSANAFVNGEEVILDVVPVEKNGRTMVPLRFISEVLGMNVGYVESTAQVLISNEQAVITVNDIDITIEDYRSLLAYMGYTPGMEVASGDIDEVTKLLVQSYAASGTLGDDTATDFSAIANAYSQLGGTIYNGALFAPLAQVFEIDLKISDVINKHISGMDFEKYVNDYYLANFVNAKHILISSETIGREKAKEEAGKILDRINSGEDFDKLMNEFSSDPGLVQYPNGYVFTGGQMVKEFEDAAFSLEIGGVSDVVETSYGYHIIKREELPTLGTADANALAQNLSVGIYADIINDSIDLSTITRHKTNEEIIEMLK